MFRIFYFLWSMKFCSQNLNHPFLPSVNNVLVIEITPTKALFACFNINQNDKNLHISFCAECFIILYRSKECILDVLCLLLICARPYSIKTLNINWYHKSHVSLWIRKFQFLLNAWGGITFFRVEMREKTRKCLCNFMFKTWHEAN